MARSKLNAIENKPKERQDKQSVKVSKLQELFEADQQARFDIATDYDAHNENTRCFYHPYDKRLLGLNDVNSRLLIIALNSARKKPSTISYSIEQLVVFRSDSDDETGGKLFCRIQGNLNYVGPTSDNAKAYFDMGILQKPIWHTAVSRYDDRSGEVIETMTTLGSFLDVYIIEYSKELIESLRPHFRKCSFLFKEANGKKWTVTESDLTEDFDQVISHYKPKRQFQDGSVR